MPSVKRFNGFHSHMDEFPEFTPFDTQKLLRQNIKHIIRSGRPVGPVCMALIGSCAGSMSGHMWKVHLIDCRSGWQYFRGFAVRLIPGWQPDAGRLAWRAKATGAVIPVNLQNARTGFNFAEAAGLY